jgi:hypothetical protein
MKTELYLNGSLLDLFDDININLSYSLTDIENPTNRQSTFSRTIEIPSTANNDSIFNQIFLFDQWVLDFDPNVKADAFILQDGSEIFNGIGQLLSIKDNGTSKTYEIGLFGQSANLFKTIEGKELTDIDFSDLNHYWNEGNITDSWDVNVSAPGVGYYYPFVDYGQNFERQNTSPASFLYTDADFYPAIYVREYVDRIITDAGFTWESDFFDSNYFKRLIIPYGVASVPYLSESVLSTFLYRIRLKNMTFPIQTSNPYPANGSTYTLEMGVSTPSPYFDGGNYNTTTYKYTAPANESLNLQFTTTCFPDANYVNVTATFKLYKNGSFYDDFFALNWDGSELGNPKSLTGFISAVSLSVGDTLEVRMNVTNVAGTVKMRVVWNETYWLNQLAETPTMQPGYFWDMSQTIVPKIKQSELLNGLINMFNLFIMPDKNEPTKLLIEPYKDFYFDTANDWTSKWDVAKGYEVTPNGYLSSKLYNFKYKNGGAFFEKRYQDSYQSGYGDRLYKVNNDFSTDTNSKETVFACCTMAGYTSSARIAPRFWDLDQSGVVKGITAGLRVLYASYITYPKVSGDFYFNSVLFDNYPYAGTLDNPYNPLYDLLFGIPQELYYSNTAENTSVYKYTNGNLFNVYWKNYIDELTDSNAKKVTLYVNLTPNDIAQLDFRKLVYINNTLFRILAISDYDANSRQSTKVDLLKVTDQPEFVPTVFELTNGTGAFILDEPQPKIITNLA